MRPPSRALLRRALIGDFRVGIIRTALARLRGAPVVLGRSFRLVGLQNVDFAPGASLVAGTTFYGFADRHSRGLIRVRGRLRIEGRVTVAPGCRFDVLPGAVMSVGADTYFSPNVQAVVGESLTIGSGCAIAWDVHFLDDDRHSFRTDDGELRPHRAAIVIGDRVWIGSGVHIYKGVHLADGVVVAGNSTVTRSVDEPNALVGGTPARVLKSGVRWE